VAGSTVKKAKRYFCRFDDSKTGNGMAGANTVQYNKQLCSTLTGRCRAGNKNSSSLTVKIVRQKPRWVKIGINGKLFLHCLAADFLNFYLKRRYSLKSIKPVSEFIVITKISFVGLM
jgi:hypothetical protein